MDLGPICHEQDVCWRMAARHGLDFYVVESPNGYASVTTKESGYRHPEETREATGPELLMWRQIVPQEDRDLVSRAGMYQEVPPLTATPEELYCAIRYRKAVYLSAQDAAVLRRLEGFEPSVERKDLKRGLIGRFSDPDRERIGMEPAEVFISRDVPTGYCLQTDGEVEGLNWRPLEGERTVMPALEDRVDLRKVLGCVRPMEVDLHDDVKVRLRS